MKITKLVHSCLLIEGFGQKLLFDPGQFSFESNLYQASETGELDYVFITHTHFDHFDSDFISLIKNDFPNVTFIANEEVAQRLDDLEIKTATEIPEFAQSFEARHETLPWGKDVPQNTGFHLFDKLTNPGDSFALKTTADVLVLPIQAPWGSATQAFQKALELEPETIIPVHDYHWRDQVRQGFYDQAEQFFADYGIDFVGAKNGQEFGV